MDIPYLPALPLPAYCNHVCYITTGAHVQVKKALDAKHVINVCSSLDSSKAMRALQQLLDNAAVIKSMVSLSGEHPLYMYMKKQGFQRQSAQQCSGAERLSGCMRMHCC